MAKSNVVQIKLISTADTGYFYVTKKNARAQTTKLELNKYDPVVRKHVKFKEAKIKYPRRATFSPASRACAPWRRWPSCSSTRPMTPPPIIRIRQV